MIHLYFIFIEVAAALAEYRPLRQYALKKLKLIKSLSNDDYLLMSRKYSSVVNQLRFNDRNVAQMLQFETNKQTISAYVPLSHRDSQPVHEVRLFQALS